MGIVFLIFLVKTGLLKIIFNIIKNTFIKGIELKRKITEFFNYEKFKSTKRNNFDKSMKIKKRNNEVS